MFCERVKILSSWMNKKRLSINDEELEVARCCTKVCTSPHGTPCLGWKRNTRVYATAYSTSSSSFLSYLNDSFLSVFYTRALILHVRCFTQYPSELTLSRPGTVTRYSPAISTYLIYCLAYNSWPGRVELVGRALSGSYKASQNELRASWPYVTSIVHSPALEFKLIYNRKDKRSANNGCIKYGLSSIF